MTITPNTPPFVSGSVLTAQQMTNLPMGIIAITSSTSNTLTGSILSGLTTTFTSVANRTYRISVMLQTTGATAGDRLIVAINANTSGINRVADYIVPTNTTYYTVLNAFVIYSPAAGSKTIEVDWNRVVGNILPGASSGVSHQLVIEDMGTA